MVMAVPFSSAIVTLIAPDFPFFPLETSLTASSMRAASDFKLPGMEVSRLAPLLFPKPIREAKLIAMEVRAGTAPELEASIRVIEN
jgi:hypothetical protein